MRQWRLQSTTVWTEARHPIPIQVDKPYGLDMTALAGMAGAFGIEQDQIFFEKLRAFELACLRIWAGEQSCSAQKKANCRFKFGKYLDWACGKCPDNPEAKAEGNRREAT